MRQNTFNVPPVALAEDYLRGDHYKFEGLTGAHHKSGTYSQLSM